MLIPPLPLPGSEPTGPSTTTRDGRPLSASLVAEATARLQCVRGDMTAEQFEALVRDVARFTLRWSDEYRATPGTPRADQAVVPRAD